MVISWLPHQITITITRIEFNNLIEFKTTC